MKNQEQKIRVYFTFWLLFVGCIQAYLVTVGGVSETLLIPGRGITLLASVTCLSLGRSECTGAT